MKWCNILEGEIDHVPGSNFNVKRLPYIMEVAILHLPLRILVQMNAIM